MKCSYVAYMRELILYNPRWGWPSQVTTMIQGSTLAIVLGILIASHSETDFYETLVHLSEPFFQSCKKIIFLRYPDFQPKNVRNKLELSWAKLKSSRK